MQENGSVQGSVREVRVAFTVEDFDGAVALYGEALGLSVIKYKTNPRRVIDKTLPPGSVDPYRSSYKPSYSSHFILPISGF